MAIELLTTVDVPLIAKQLGIGVLREFANVTGLEDVPPVTICALANRQVTELAATARLEADQAMYAIRLSGREETVTLHLTAYEMPPGKALATLSVAWTRSNTEYVVAIAAAIYLGLRGNTSIEDSFGFWFRAAEFDPRMARAELRVTAPFSSLDEAAQAIVGERRMPNDT
jgi:hypothetical protein